MAQKFYAMSQDVVLFLITIARQVFGFLIKKVLDNNTDRNAGE